MSSRLRKSKAQLAEDAALQVSCRGTSLSKMAVAVGRYLAVIQLQVSKASNLIAHEISTVLITAWCLNPAEDFRVGKRVQLRCIHVKAEVTRTPPALRRLQGSDEARAFGGCRDAGGCGDWDNSLLLQYQQADGACEG